MPAVVRGMIALLLVITLSFVTAYFEVLALSALWRWFIAAQYGPPPTHATLYGITIAITFIVQMALLNVARTQREDGTSPAEHALAQTIGAWIGIAIFVGVAWLVGLATGWGA